MSLPLLLMSRQKLTNENSHIPFMSRRLACYRKLTLQFCPVLSECQGDKAPHFRFILLHVVPHSCCKYIIPHHWPMFRRFYVSKGPRWPSQFLTECGLYDRVSIPGRGKKNPSLSVCVQIGSGDPSNLLLCRYLDFFPRE
jgi:hypothetical protein